MDWSSAAEIAALGFYLGIETRDPLGYTHLERVAGHPWKASATRPPAKSKPLLSAWKADAEA